MFKLVNCEVNKWSVKRLGYGKSVSISGERCRPIKVAEMKKKGMKTVSNVSLQVKSKKKKRKG